MAEILIIEDDQDIGARLKEGLASFGFVVEHVEDGEHALSFALQEEFDAIVLDLGLPGLSGIEVLRRLRRTGAATPVLILTARSSHGSDSRVMEQLYPMHTGVLQAQ